MVDIRCDAGGVLDDVVVGRGSSALRRLLRHQKEIVALIQRHFIVNNSAAVHVAGIRTLLLEKSSVDPLADDDESDGRHRSNLHAVVNSSTRILN